MQFNKYQLINSLLNNIASQPKAKYANDIIITMARRVMTDHDTIQAEKTRSTNAFNRGSMVECLVRLTVNRYCTKNWAITEQKSQMGTADLDTTELNAERLAMIELPKSKDIEIKFANSFANGSKMSHQTEWVLVANNQGLYLVKGNEVNTDKTGHVLPKQPNGKRLAKLSYILGYDKK